jgi:hypothetical protein
VKGKVMPLLAPRREHHLAGGPPISWFPSFPELWVDFPRTAPIGLARHKHSRPHRLYSHERNDTECEVYCALQFTPGRRQFRLSAIPAVPR